MGLFEELLATKHYQDLLKQLPEDDREAVKKSLKEFVDRFENGIIRPLQNFKNK